jgi:hypothetical protein
LLVRVQLVKNAFGNGQYYDGHFIVGFHHTANSPIHGLGEVDALYRRVQGDACRSFGEINAAIDGHVHEAADTIELLDGTQETICVARLGFDVVSENLHLRLKGLERSAQVMRHIT